MTTIEERLRERRRVEALREAALSTGGPLAGFERVSPSTARRRSSAPFARLKCADARITISTAARPHLGGVSRVAVLLGDGDRAIAFVPANADEPATKFGKTGTMTMRWLMERLAIAGWSDGVFAVEPITGETGLIVRLDGRQA